MDGPSIYYLRTLALTALAAATLMPGLSAHATTITAGGSFSVANGGTALGSITNYDFLDFGMNGQPKVLTDFTVSTAGRSQYPGNGAYTSVIAPGGSSAFTTGIAYDSSRGNTAGTSVIATFSPNANGSFDVYILDANTDGNAVGNTFVGLGVNGGAALSTATIYSGLNQYTEYHVTNALSTDVFQVYATTGGNQFPSLGGLTFDLAETSPVPEPGSLALLGTGLVGAFGVARRKL